MRATLGITLDDVSILAVSGKGWWHKSAVLAGTSPADEVDNLFNLTIRGMEILSVGEEGMLATTSRPALVNVSGLEITGAR